MKSFIKFLKYLVLIFAIGAGAFYSGSFYEKNKNFKTEQLKRNQSVQIAVVNQDLGTDYNKEYVNYGSNIINSLSEEFIVTNREAAKKGLNDGKYGAIIIIPGNFSKNIITINDKKPEKTQVFYETNPKLSASNNLAVNTKINSWKNELSNKLTYLYVASIFKEYHVSQDHVKKVLKNDKESIELLKGISDSDILADIKINELKKEELEIATLDISKNFEENKKIIDQIDAKYKECLEITKSNFNLIADNGENLITKEEGIKSFKNDINEVNVLPESMEYNYELDELEALKTAGLEEIEENKKSGNEVLNKYKEDSKKLIEDIQSKVLDYNNQIIESISKEESISELNIKNKDKIGNNLDNILLTLQDINKNQEESMQVLQNQQDRIDSLQEETKIYTYIIDNLIKNDPEEFKRISEELGKDQEKIEWQKIIKTINANTTTISTDEKIKVNKKADKIKGEENFTNSLEYIKEINKEGYSFTERLKEYGKIKIDVSKDTVDGLQKIENFTKEAQKEVQNLGVNFESSKINIKVMKNIQKESQEYIEDIVNKIDFENRFEKIYTNYNDTLDRIYNLVSKNNDDLITNTENIVIDVVQKEVESNWQNTISKNQEKTKDLLLNIFDKWDEELEKFQNLIKEFNPLKSIEEQKDKFIEFIYNYNSNSEELQKNINQKSEEDQKSIENIYEISDENTNTMKMDLDNAIKDSQEKLSEGLKSAKETTEDKTKKNKQYLFDFSEKLSNTRVGTVENTSIYNFISNPLNDLNLTTKTFNENENNKANNIKMSKERLIMVSGILVFIMLINIVSILYKKIIKKKLK